MAERRRVKHAVSFSDRLKIEAARLLREAEGKPPGPQRDELMMKLSQIETALRIEKWASSPGLKPPT